MDPLNGAVTGQSVNKFWNSNRQVKNSSDVKSRDSLDISNSAKAFQKIDDFLNLGKPDRLIMDGMSDGEKEEFLKMLSKLLKEGIVGYEYLEVDGKKEKHFIVNQLKNDRIRDAKLWNRLRDEPGIERK